MKIRLLIQSIPIRLIQGYRYIISPLLPPSCRFTPTCSCYAIEAIESHGTLRGLLLSFFRILRCHPFCQGGYDPVPPVKGEKGRYQDKSASSQGSRDERCTTQTLTS